MYSCYFKREFLLKNLQQENAIKFTGLPLFQHLVLLVQYLVLLQRVTYTLNHVKVCLKSSGKLNNNLHIEDLQDSFSLCIIVNSVLNSHLRDISILCHVHYATHQSENSMHQAVNILIFPDKYCNFIIHLSFYGYSKIVLESNQSAVISYFMCKLRMQSPYSLFITHLVWRFRCIRSQKAQQHSFALFSSNQLKVHYCRIMMVDRKLSLVDTLICAANINFSTLLWGINDL